ERKEGAYRSGGNFGSGVQLVGFPAIPIRRSFRHFGICDKTGFGLSLRFLWNVSLGKENSGIGCRNTGRT
ncbi:hypothetical protein, partial [Alistipes ihumii]|uniref:hypothetical protein n=1 Tax=Alistipes ihumii TaxID=1470347 RepID=UPI003AB645E0